MRFFPTLVQVRPSTFAWITPHNGGAPGLWHDGSAPALAAIQRCVALMSHVGGAGSADVEQDTSARELARLCSQWRLGRAWLRAYAPGGSIPGPDDGVLTPQGLPWWRAHLAAMVAVHSGFGGHRPWEVGVTDLAIPIFGTRIAVDTVRAVYAAATFACVSVARHAPAGELDAFLLGAAVGIVSELEQSAKQNASTLERVARTALIMRPMELPVAANVENVMSKAQRAIEAGFARAAGLGRRALGVRALPAPMPSFTYFTPRGL